MPNQKELTIQPIGAWLAQVLRSTAFYCQTQEFDLSGWWAKLTGSSPEKETNQIKTASRIVEGAYGNHKLILHKNPLVIEIRFQPNEVTPYYLDDIPVVGRFEEEYEKFSAMVKKLFNLEGFPLIKRVAFGAVLNLSVTDYNLALEQLAPYIKTVKIDPTNSRDFLYQINRRRHFRVGSSDSFVNRLSKWSVVSYQTVTAGSQSAITSEPRQACQLELDINTSQDIKSALPSDELVTLFDELVKMGIEIISHGDIQ